MPTFHEELERRIEQFKHCLERMRQRRTDLTRGNCYIIFKERLDEDDPVSPELAESTALVHEPAIEVAGRDTGFSTSTLDETIVVDLPGNGWRGDDSESRFIQFSFNARYFDLDIAAGLYRVSALLSFGFPYCLINWAKSTSPPNAVGITVA